VIGQNAAPADLAAAPELQEDALGGVLASLVATRSVNPGTSEAAMAQQIASLLDGTGCELTFVESMPDRPSLAAVLRGSHGEPRLVLNGHMDTVPIDDPSRWTADPFGGEIREDAIWGRGSVDMKGGLTTQIACARVLGTMRDRLRGTLVLHFAAGEECGEPGTLSLIERGFVGDWGITTEPTSLAVATAMRGVAWFRIRIEGRSGHASCPEAALNPNLVLNEVLAALRDYDAQLRTRSHPLIGSPGCTPTVIRSGIEHNAIPDGAELVVDRRMIPGDSRDRALEELRRLVGGLDLGGRGFGWSVEPHLHVFEPAEISADAPLARLVDGVVEEVTGAPARRWGTPYGSDVRNLVNDAGMEAITFGPGDVSKCHCPDEHLPLSELRLAAVVITRVAAQLLCE
jgi:succinyl-diaminopimelate desuccinylase